MKTFFNVLYRRILYKIPLKFLLILLALFAICFASFSNAMSVPDSNFNPYDTLDWYYSYNRFQVSLSNINTIVQLDLSNDYDFYCMRHDNNVVYFWYTNNNVNNWVWINAFTCVSPWTIYVRWTADLNIYMFAEWEWIVPEWSMTSLECQTEYNLIPISSVDSNYCTTNNLCPNIPVCPSGSGSVSNLYINDILHVGSPFINITIPEEISRDYEYTQWWTNMNIDIEGYNVDYEYVSSVIDLQNYKPDASDLSSIVSGILPLFVPWLVIILFLYFIFRFIKKIF